MNPQAFVELVSTVTAAIAGSTAVTTTLSESCRCRTAPHADVTLHCPLPPILGE